MPLLVNLQPAGEYLGEDYHHAGGVPAVVAELMKATAAHPRRPDGERQDDRRQLQARSRTSTEGDPPLRDPLKQDAGFIVLRGNLFDSAIMKTSVISQEFRDRYLGDPEGSQCLRGQGVVFDGPEDYHPRIDDPALGIDENTILFMRGAGPIGYPGAAEVVNMRRRPT